MKWEQQGTIIMQHITTQINTVKKRHTTNHKATVKKRTTNHRATIKKRNIISNTTPTIIINSARFRIELEKVNEEKPVSFSRHTIILSKMLKKLHTVYSTP